MNPKPAAPRVAAAAMAAADATRFAGAPPEGLLGGGLPPAGLPGPQQEGGQQEVGAAHGTPWHPGGRRMTATEEFDFLKEWDPWHNFLNQLKAEKKYNVQWRHILSHHTSTPCQPRKEPGTVTSLASAGLNNPKGASGTWTVSLDLPHMFAPGDHFQTYYDSPTCNTKSDAQETACFYILALFLVSGCWMVKLPAKAFTDANAIWQRAELLQEEYGKYHKSYGTQALLPTYQCVDQGHAPRPQPVPTQHRGGPRPPLTGESKDNSDAHVVTLLGNLKKGGAWHRANSLPREIWIGLKELMQPGELWEFFKRHPHEFEVQVREGLFRWAPFPAAPPAAHVEQPPPAHGSGVGAQPLGSWFAVKGVHATPHYGRSQAVQCNTLDVVDYRSGTLARHRWEDVWCLVSIPPEQDLKVGEELCAWWDGWCHQVTYVGPEATGSTASRHGRIIVTWDDHQETKYPMPLDKVWALQAGGDPGQEARLAAAK